MSQIIHIDSIEKMALIDDEAMCVLRAHLMLEIFLNVWTIKQSGDIYNTDNTICKSIVTFTIKLTISENLGLDKKLIKVLKKINAIRNKFSHQINFSIKKADIDSLQNLVNDIITTQDNSKGALEIVKKDGSLVKYKWDDSNNRVKFLIIFGDLIHAIMKLYPWAINKNNSTYDIETT